ncbi:MAG: AraC family transcriptional regulator [Polyangiaceae bacterium]
MRPEIDKALRFIAARLDQELTVADVASAAGLSEFHFHRVFHADVGESVGRFVTRRRLELAALRLAYEPERSVTEIALSSGYSSSSNFGKAFQGYFGCSPTEVRRPSGGSARIGKLTALYGKDFRADALYALPALEDAGEVEARASYWSSRVRFEDAPAQPLACLARVGPYDPTAIEETWRELIGRVQQLGIAAGAIDAWGIAHDSPHVTAPERCRYHACVPCRADAPLSPPLFRGERPGGRWAIFSYDGPTDELGDAYRAIYSCWFRRGSVAPADYVPLDHYIADFPVAGRVALEMWFRVQAKGS